MKLLSLICCGVLCAVQAIAQTNNIRSLTLDEAIELAVEHNFTVQLARYNPRIDRFTISGDYGVYDPTFNASGKQTFQAIDAGQASVLNLTTNSVGVVVTNFPSFVTLPPHLDYNQAYTAGISGYAPSGLNYSLDSGVTRFTTDTPFQQEYNTFTSVGLSQPLLRNFWTDASRTQIEFDKKTLKIDELGLRGQLISIVSSTEQAYYELSYSFENVKVQQAALELAERLVAENRRKVEVGALAPLDEKQAESQAASSKADLIVAYGTLDSQENVLKNLISDKYVIWHDVTITPAQKLLAVPERFDLQESWRKGLTSRPDYLQAKTDLERRGITLKYRFNQLLPQLNVNGSYARNGTAGTFTPALGDISDERLPGYTVGASLSIPLSNRAARNAYKAVKTQNEQAALQFKQTEQTILVAIDNAIKSANTDYQQVQATHAASEYSRIALEAEQKKLEVGKSTSFQVLQLQKDLTAARSAEIRAVANYNQDLSRIAQAEGTTLDKFHLNVKIY